MLIDLRGQPGGFHKDVDLCVIGAGAAGIAIAQHFVGHGLHVALIESGAAGFEKATQQLYGGASRGQPVDLVGGRVRSFGGSMNHWGGRCAEFSEGELAQRAWIPNSGWPLRLDDLRPYYRRAWKLCGFETSGPYAQDVLTRLDASFFDDFAAEATPQVWRFAPSSGGLFLNFGTTYFDALRHAPNITLLFHANFTGFDTDEHETHVKSVLVRSLTGVQATISARYFVLCCSGIENARLLLAGGARRSPGIGNANGVVGRYFMEHSRAVAATLFTADRLSVIQDALTEFEGADGVRYQVGLALSERIQRKRRLLNCSAVLAYAGDPTAGVTAAQDVWRNLRDGHWPGRVGTDVWNIIRDTGSIETNVERALHGQPPLLPLQSAAIVVDIEQVPDPESRITCSPETRDALGMPTTVVDWRVSDLERETVRQFMLELGLDFARRGIGRLRMEPWLESTGKAWRPAISETYHYIGSTRMSVSPRTGVVDVDCRVHDLDNLFIGGSSVFPTGGQVNPTMTVVALALRLADHLSDLSRTKR